MERRSLGSSRKPLFSRPTWNCWNVHGKMEDPNRSGSLNRWGGILMIQTLKNMFFDSRINFMKTLPNYISWIHPRLQCTESFCFFQKNIVNLNDFLWWVVMNEILCCYWMNISSIVIEGNNSCLQCYDKKSIWENWGGGFPFVIFIKFLLNQWDEGVFC